VNAKANNTIDKVGQLQRKLYLSAKKGRRRFHVIYDKVYRTDILLEAWKRVRANKGASGIHNVSIADIENYVVERFLSEIQQTLTNNKYKAPPVKRVFIDKADGRKRALGIPTVKDRVVQMAVKLMIEPIFEADFKECSYGFRPKRNAKMALETVRKACNNKGYYVIDADIKTYFDNINHDKLMLLIEQRISDSRILKLIRNWLKAGILYEGNREETIIGSAQGGVISPLCSNVYLNVLDLLWEKYGGKYGKLVRYADDLVVICKNKKNAIHAMGILKAVMTKLELELHPEKTKMVSMWGGKEGFDFLGMHHRRMTNGTSKGAVYKETFQYPSKKDMKK
jgi:RNA-directed DNA polymerase